MNRTFRDRMVARIESTSAGDLAYCSSAVHINRDARDVTSEAIARRVLIAAIVDDGLFDEFAEIIKPVMLLVEKKNREKLDEVASLTAHYCQQLKLQGVSSTEAAMMSIGYSRDLMVERGLVPKPDKFGED